MPYIKIIPRDGPHNCPTPTAGARRSNSAGAGSVWLCPKCGQQWIKLRIDEDDDKRLRWGRLKEDQYLEVKRGKEI